MGCTSSQDTVRLNNVYVPEYRVIRNDDIANVSTPGCLDSTDRIYNYSAWKLTSLSLLSLATGVARHAYEYSVEEFSARRRNNDPLFSARQPAVTMHLSEASAKIHASDLLFKTSLRETFFIVKTGEELT